MQTVTTIYLMYGAALVVTTLPAMWRERVFHKAPPHKLLAACLLFVLAWPAFAVWRLRIWLSPRRL